MGVEAADYAIEFMSAGLPYHAFPLARIDDPHKRGSSLAYLAVRHNRFGIPFWGRCTTHCGTYLSGLGCSLGVRAFDTWPFGFRDKKVLGMHETHLK